MKKQENYKDIYKALKDDTDFPLPETLAPDAIVKTVASVRVQPKKRHTARYASLAAALVLVTLAGVVGIRLTNAPQNGGAVSVPKTAQNVQTVAETEDEYLRTASYAEIESFFLDRQKTYRTKSYADDMAMFGGGVWIFNEKSAAPESGAAPGSNGSGNGSVDVGSDITDSKLSASGTAHGETNTQVDGIDEADILKNDGNYLYLVRTQQSTVEIVDIRDPKNMQTAAQIDCTAESERRTVRELYVYGDTMVLLCDVYAGTENAEKGLYDVCYAYASENMKTVAEIYDVSDRTAPRLRFDYAVDGGQLSSRMDGSTLLLITSYNVPIYKNEEDMKNACVPCTYEPGEKTRFPAENVRIVSGTDSTAYLTVSRLDTQADKAEAQTKAVLGGGNEIYCDGENLLVAQADYTAMQKENGREVFSAEIGTRLYTFDIKGGVAYKGSAQVKGTTLNQFSMDSFGGYYRIATTAGDGSLVTVLNKNLETVGELRGIAKGESIYAARFMGDTAYLVTFRRTDPLFIIDLSDPAAPKVTGELKIPGFSNYLHPYSENLLIGIGQDGTASGANNKLKISLFDVSDKKHPQEISQVLYSGGSVSVSAAQNTHKAFLSVRESGEFAVPVQEIIYGNAANVSYASMLTVQDGKLCITGTYKPRDGEHEIERVTYAGDTVYTLSWNTLTAFDKATGEILSEIVYNSTGNVVIK